MATIGAINVVGRANMAAFDRAMRQSGKRVNQFQSTLNNAKRQMLAFGGAMIGGAGLVSFARGSVAAFQEQEQATAALNAALDKLGVGTNDAKRRAQEFAAAIQKQTVIGDEAVLSAMSLGASMANLSGGELERATTAAIGLSRAFKMDLDSAMRLVARAAMGQTQTLSRYGIVLDETLSPQDKFNQLLRIGADNFRLAQAEAKNLTGQMQQLKNEYGDLQEVAGEYVMKAAVGAKWLGEMAIGRDVTGRAVEQYIARFEATLQQFDDTASRVQRQGTVGAGQSTERRMELLREQLRLARQLQDINTGDLLVFDQGTIISALTARDSARIRSKELEAQLKQLQQVMGLEQSRRNLEAAFAANEQRAAERRAKNAQDYAEAIDDLNAKYLGLTDAGKRSLQVMEWERQNLQQDQIRVLLQGYDAIIAKEKELAEKSALADNLKQAAEEMKWFADAVRDGLKTPHERFLEYWTKLDAAVKSGALSRADAEAAYAAEWQKTYGQGKGGTSGPRDFGTTSLSAIEARGLASVQGGRDPQLQRLNDIASATREGNEYLRRILLKEGLN